MAKFRVHDTNGAGSRAETAPAGAGPTAQVSGSQDRVRGAILDAFSRGVDALEANIGRAPADLQPHARQAVGVARERPWLTMAGLAAVGLMLARPRRRRR